MKDRMVLIGIDWGASDSRAWAFDEDGEVSGGSVCELAGEAAARMAAAAQLPPRALEDLRVVRNNFV